MQYVIHPGGPLKGTIKVDGDKSISHRAVMFGALAQGTTTIQDILKGDDVVATIQAFRQMGVSIVEESNDELSIRGVGLRGLQQPKTQLDMGNSGTAFRLLTGILCGQSWNCSLGGDSSLSGRPMGRIITPLCEMGANIRSREGLPPLHIAPSQRLQGISYEMPMASAQVKSAILLAGMYASGKTTVKEPAPTRDHTERMLNGFGYPVEREGEWISLSAGGQLKACNICVPADLSSAAFFLVAGCINPKSQILLKQVGINPSRNGILPVLERMGANISLENQSTIGGEPVADLAVSHAKLSGVELDKQDIALAVDEIPIIAVAAACAQGKTVIRGAEELRVKESDRIATTVAGLRALGVDVEELPDGMVIQGGTLSGGRVTSHGDHRIAMAFSIAGSVASSRVDIEDTECVATSFPGFSRLAADAGIHIDGAILT